MVSYSQDEGDESPSPKRRAKKKSEKSLKLSNEIVEVVWYHETKMRETKALLQKGEPRKIGKKFEAL